MTLVERLSTLKEQKVTMAKIEYQRRRDEIAQAALMFDLLAQAFDREILAYVRTDSSVTFTRNLETFEGTRTGRLPSFAFNGRLLSDGVIEFHSTIDPGYGRPTEDTNEWISVRQCDGDFLYWMRGINHTESAIVTNLLGPLLARVMGVTVAIQHIA